MDDCSPPANPAQPYSAAEIAAIERVTGSSLAVRRSPRRAGDPPRLVADPSRAQRLLGWRPALPALDEIVATAWRWHRGRNA